MSDPTFTNSDSPAILTKQWGRRWRVTVLSLKEVRPGDAPPVVVDPVRSPEEPDLVPQGGYTEVFTIEQNSWNPEGLHIKFDTTQNLYAFQWCDVTIYNLNSPTSQDLIKFGMVCQLDAGYIDGVFDTIFYGTIFQPLWEKENGTDWKLTLHCVVGMIEGTNNYIGHTVPGGITQRDLVAQMVGSATLQLDTTLDGITNTDPVTRATTYFGQPNDLLQYVADSNNALTWFNHRKVYINQLLQDDTVPEKEFNTENGLIGTPQQTEFGVELKVLLSPDLIPRGQIKLSQSIAIRQMLRMPGTYPSIITQDYRYIIGSLRHYGDSRGNDWYTEITAFYNAGVMLSMLQTRT